MRNECRCGDELDGDAVFQESPHSFSLASQVTYTEHETGEAFTREMETTLPLPLPHLTPRSRSEFDWMSLPTDAAENDTRWEVRFRCDAARDVVDVDLHCANVQYPAAFRLLATEVSDSHNWMETADVVEMSSRWMSRWSFPKRRVELDKSARRLVRVRVRWTRV